MDKHQVAGFDERERGFCRPVEFEQAEGGVRAILRYETLRVVTEVRSTQATALEDLILMLQKRGHSHLRSQLSVRNGTYLGSQEPWIEYQDPERTSDQLGGWFGRLLRCFQRRSEEANG